MQPWWQNTAETCRPITRPCEYKTFLAKQQKCAGVFWVFLQIESFGDTHNSIGLGLTGIGPVNPHIGMTRVSEVGGV